MKNHVLTGLAALFITLGHLPPAAAAAPKSVQAAAGTSHPSVRIITLKGPYADNPSTPGMDPFSLLMGGMEQETSFPALTSKIDAIVNDAAIDHVLFDVSSASLDMNRAQLAELSRHIGRLRKAGKKTFAWLENADPAHYSIAAACDKIVMTELGTLDFPSLSIGTLHFKDAMDKLGIQASVARAGNFKGAVEPFTLSEMSPELRAHYQEMVGTMNDAFVARVAAGRKLPPELVRKLQADRLFTAAEAQKAGLIDLTAAQGSQRDSVTKLLGEEVSWIEPKKSRAKPMSLFELFGKLMGGMDEAAPLKPAVAVLHLDGQIIDGERDLPGLLASGPTQKAIDELRTDPGIKAVVVRINSPGGSASASEAIRSALAKLSKRKPVVVSFGDMAASGGYWISAFGRPIYAEAETITGSIGAFALKLSGGPLLKKIGVKAEHVSLDESAGAMFFDRAWTPGEQARVNALLQEIYGKFLELVADSRNLKRDQMEALAGGRVWSGAQAARHKLIDHLGGLDEAIVSVAAEAKLGSDYAVVHRPRQKNIFETLDLFRDSKDEVDLLNPAGLRLLREAGYDASFTMRFLRQNLGGPAVKIWLLLPSQIQIR